jgi:hypothetical protein
MGGGNNMKFSRFMLDFFNFAAANIQLGFPGKITRYDAVMMRADVQLLLQKQNDQGDIAPYAVLPNIPVQFIFAGGFYIRPVYAVGDLVWVSFSTFDIANAMNLSTQPESEAIFQLQNASVSGSIAPNNFTPPAEFAKESGMIIGEKTGTAYMVFSPTNITFKFGPLQNIVMDATGISVMVGGVATPIGPHTHLSAAPGSPTGPMTPGS